MLHATGNALNPSGIDTREPVPIKPPDDSEGFWRGKKGFLLDLFIASHRKGILGLQGERS